MACIVKSRHPNGTTYVYEVSQIKWDPVKKMSVPKRHLIGKIDPVTGETVPTGRRGRPRKDARQNVARVASAGPSPETGRFSDEASVILEAVADRKRQQRTVCSQARDEFVRLQRVKMELRKAEAALDELIVAVQQSV